MPRLVPDIDVNPKQTENRFPAALGVLLLLLTACSHMKLDRPPVPPHEISAQKKTSFYRMPPAQPSGPVLASPDKSPLTGTATPNTPTRQPAAVSKKRNRLFEPLTEEKREPVKSLSRPALAEARPNKPKTPISIPPGTPNFMLDDLDRKSLKKAIARQLDIMREADLSKVVPLGPLRVSQQELVETLEEFRDLLDWDLTAEELHLEIQRKFSIIEVGRQRKNKKVLVTGYYTPVIPARRHRSGSFQYPLYRKPDNYPATRVVFRQSRPSNRDNAYHMFSSEENILLTRKQIDSDFILQDQQLEVAWLQDDLDRYFLHIQGSGFLSFPDGQMEAVQFAGSNEFPYRSVGQKMIRDGVISVGQGSMQGIKQYFREHPEDIPKYLYQNKRYIFFNLTDGSPRGSSGAELVGGRSIATDKRVYAAGGLAFLSAKKPVLNESMEITGWEEFSRFVVDQDTGSAIKGPGRVDLYFGVGRSAGEAAGHYMQTGKLYYLLKK